MSCIYDTLHFTLPLFSITYSEDIPIVVGELSLSLLQAFLPVARISRERYCCSNTWGRGASLKVGLMQNLKISYFTLSPKLSSI